MSYGHAERNLAATERITRETAQYLRSLRAVDSDQSQWLSQVARDHRDLSTLTNAVARVDAR